MRALTKKQQRDDMIELLIVTLLVLSYPLIFEGLTWFADWLSAWTYGLVSEYMLDMRPSGVKPAFSTY